jgi:hypothetical protein
LEVSRKDDIPYQFWATTRSLSFSSINDTPIHSKSYEKIDFSIFFFYDLNHKQIEISMREIKWGNMLPLEDTKQVDANIMDDQHDSVYLLEENL